MSKYLGSEFFLRLGMLRDETGTDEARSWAIAEYRISFVFRGALQCPEHLPV